MARRSEFEYDLARIQLDKRQLRLEERQLELERKELEFKQKLAHLDTVDLIEDDLLVEPESSFRATDSSQLFSQDATSTKPIGKDFVVNEGDTDVTEKPEKLKGSATASKITTDASSIPTRENLAKQVDSTGENAPHAPAPASSSQPLDHVSESKELLNRFHGSRPEFGKQRLRTGSKRAHSPTKGEKEPTRRSKNSDGEAINSDSADSGRAKRRRMSRGENKQETRSFGAITESEQYSLVSHYKDLFLRRMQTVERELDLEGGNKNTIAARVRHLNVGKAHSSITSLHEEFNQVALDHAKSSPLQAALQTEMSKFERASRYWFPKCKGLSTQEVRLSMVSEMVQKIVDGEFNIEDFHDDYDPQEEL